MILKWMKFYIKNMVNDILRLTLGNKYPSPLLSEDDMKHIDRELYKIMPKEKIKRLIISEKEYSNFESKYSFSNTYDKRMKRYARKICEYYVVELLLGFGRIENKDEYIYLDAMSSSSPWADFVQERFGIHAYAVDIKEPTKPRPVFIKGDVTNLQFKNSSVDAVSVQSGIELLDSDKDIKFVMEVERILKPGGKFIILPIYLNKMSCNLFGKKYYKEGICEKDSVKFARLDFDLPFTRLYNVQSLYDRLISRTKKGKWILYMIESDGAINLVDKRDNFIYLRYALMYKKTIQ